MAALLPSQRSRYDSLLSSEIVPAWRAGQVKGEEQYGFTRPFSCSDIAARWRGKPSEPGSQPAPMLIEIKGPNPSK